MKTQRIALLVFFPSMYFCASYALYAIWFGEAMHDAFFYPIPTSLIIGIAAGITWAISTIIECKNIAKARK